MTTKKKSPLTSAASVTLNQNDIPTMENGRISTEDYNAFILAIAAAEYEAGREAREAYIAKKKIAYDELIALGVSLESASLMADYYEEEVGVE